MYYFISLFFLYCYGHHRDLHSFLHDALPIYGGAHHSRGALRLLPRPPAASGPSGEPLDDGHVRLAAAFAHGLQAVASSAPLELVQERGHEPRARRPDRMTEGDRAAVDVDPPEVGVELALPGEHHRGKGFVDLEEIDVAELQSAPRQCLPRGGNRRGQHPDGIRAPHREVVNARPGLELEALYRAFRGDQESGRRIGDLAGDGRRDAAAGRERLERRHLLERRAEARRLVLLEAADGCDLAPEEAAPDGLQRAAVALQRVLLHLPAADVPFRGGHFRGAELRHLLGAVALAPAAGAAEGVQVTE